MAMREKTKGDITFSLSQDDVDRVISSLKTSKAAEPPIVAAVTAKLSQPTRKAVLELWSEALDRLNADDTDGAIITARALLEATCKAALRETHTPYFEGADLPKLYSLASAALGIAAAGQMAQTLKSLFGAAVTLVRSVEELRNEVSDAHAEAESRMPVLNSQAELAVNVTGAFAQFLMTAIESHIAASNRIDLKAGSF